MGSAACAEARAKVSEALAAVDELERGLPVRERSLMNLVRPLSLAIAELTAEVERLVKLRNEDNIALGNLFAQTASEVLPGPYRNDENGRPWRIEYEMPKRDHVVVTDPLGGREMTVKTSVWESWALAEAA